VRAYRGIKEDVYAGDFRPDLSLCRQLGLRDSDIIVTVRPPATEAHYHNAESERLLNELMSRICRLSETRAVLLPRNRHQEDQLRANHPEWFVNGKTIVPCKAVDGLNLLWLSDLVVGGGGTINREAAALGVPAYSIFRGPIGAVDLKLEAEGRLTFVRNTREVYTKIRFARRDKTRSPDNRPRPALQDIVEHIEDIIRAEKLLYVKPSLSRRLL
jgi:predicted glycosyltransferase